MKLEAGKNYRLDNGDKITVSYEYGNEYWPLIATYSKSPTGKLYIDSTGKTQSGLGDYSTPNVVEEWEEPKVESTTEPSGRVTVDITEQLDDLIREDLEWSALQMLEKGNDKYEFIGNKADLFASFCRVIEYYSDRKQWEEFVAKTKGKKVE